MKKSLNILFVCPYLPHVGVHAGAGRMYYIIRELAEFHNISVITFYEHEGELQFLPALQTLCKKVIPILRSENHSHKDWFHIKPSEITRVFGSDVMLNAIQEEITSTPYDILQFEYLFTGHFLSALKIPIGIQAVLSDHEVLSRKYYIDFQHCPVFEKPERIFRWCKMVSFSEKIYSKFNSVVALTEEDRGYIQSFNPRLKTRIAPMGVDTGYFQPLEEREKTNSLLFVGNFKHFPNVDAVQFFCSGVFPQIQAKIKNLQLFIVGSDPPEEILRLKNHEGVTVTGNVDDLRPYYDSSTVVIVPVRLGTGMRGKILEAWAMKKPVVSTSLGSEGLHCRNAYDILIANTPEEFTSVIVSLLSDTSLCHSISRNGYERACNEFTWKSVAMVYDKLYNELVAQ